MSTEYRPSDNEEFMNEQQLLYFRGKLEHEKANLLKELHSTLDHMQEGAEFASDAIDRVSDDEIRFLELRTRSRAAKLIKKIDQALDRIRDGSYGYCEETGEPISLKRLEARPATTLSLEAQEAHERREKMYRE